MNTDLVLENLTNPALLFFLLGILSVSLKSDLEIPKSSSKFISLYLLFSIGFKGGQELAHSSFDSHIIWVVLFGVSTAFLIPVLSFFILKKKLGTENAGVLAAAYGSVSAVTFVTAVAFLDIRQISFGGHMVALMAMMEAPAIIVGVFLVNMFKKDNAERPSLRELVFHSFTNGSVFLIMGSLFIGFLAPEKQAQEIAPFTTDIFKGFLAVFLLDMGIISGRKLADFCKYGAFPFLFAVLIPLFIGMFVAVFSGLITQEAGDRLLLTVLTASASYIAVPAAAKRSIPEANPGLYIPMALAVTFPFNITIGIPLYFYLIERF